ncbi:MAG: phosphate regulon sensor histidine kinase PhoR [Gammaproteobacteria bacterium]|nr:phosphate regulon sensor histidine kinase PhoR [Gammaproteobacteria bacterium]
MKLPQRWTSQLGLLAAWLGGAVLLGLWFGAISWWLVAALALYVAHVLRQVYMLDRVLFGEKRAPSFETRGLWAELLARVEKIRAKARSRKKKYHRLLREVWESTGALRDGGIILNADHEILWCNPAATTLLGLDPARDIGNRIDNLVRHPDFVRYLTAPKGEEVTIPSPVRQDAWLAITIIPYGQNQRLAIARDVTRQVKLETMRRDFVANASHELRSPLTVIRGYLDALDEDGELPKGLEAPVAEMRRQADRMTQILEDLIELTRLESAEPAAPKELVDVAALLGRIVEELARSAEGRTLELHLETDLALLGSESELHSVFYNLIHNAVRFTPPPGRIDVTWRASGEGAELSVKDTGIGIPEDQVPRITERFYRVDPGRSRATGGTGLGLSIVKHALQRHGATLAIESREGEGSTFTCRFPPERIARRGGSERAPGRAVI